MKKIKPRHIAEASLIAQTNLIPQTNQADVDVDVIVLPARHSEPISNRKRAPGVPETAGEEVARILSLLAAVIANPGGDSTHQLLLSKEHITALGVALRTYTLCHEPEVSGVVDSGVEVYISLESKKTPGFLKILDCFCHVYVMCAQRNIAAERRFQAESMQDGWWRAPGQQSAPLPGAGYCLRMDNPLLATAVLEFFVVDIIVGQLRGMYVGLLQNLWSVVWTEWGGWFCVRLVPRSQSSRTPEPILSYPGTNPLVPRNQSSRTPEPILSYPGTNPLVPRNQSSRTPEPILSYPGTNLPPPSSPFFPRNQSY